MGSNETASGGQGESPPRHACFSLAAVFVLLKTNRSQLLLRGNGAEGRICIMAHSGRGADICETKETLFISRPL